MLQQFIFDSFLKAYASRKEVSWRFRFWSIARKQLLSSSALVTYRLGNYPIQIAASHILPMVMIDHPDYAGNLVRLARAIKIKYPDMSMVDIGANIGDTVALLRSSVDIPILCIDGSAEYYPLLKQNVSGFSKVEIAMALLGEKDEEAGAEVVNHDGTAMLVASENKVRLRRLGSVLQEHPLLTTPRLIKIDTDGFDTLIIKGSQDVLLKDKPILFFEYDPDFLKLHGEDDLSVFEVLRACGYSKLLFWDNFGKYLQQLDLSEKEQIRELHLRYCEKQNASFVDIAAFHKEDEGIAMSVSGLEEKNSD